MNILLKECQLWVETSNFCLTTSKIKIIAKLDPHQVHCMQLF